MGRQSDLTGHSFVVYAASAIYIVGIPKIMIEFQVGHQEALLGLSLYIFGCESPPPYFCQSRNL
jgi:hypothetical protein